MSFTWNTMAVGETKIQEVDTFPTLGGVLLSMATLAWERPDNKLVDWITEDQRGEVVAIAIFGPAKELMITCADGMRITIDMPERYR
jgi:hypothetical protein